MYGCHAGVNMACSIAMMVLELFGIQWKMCGMTMDTPMSGFLSIWWIAAAAAFTDSDGRADDALEPKNAWREAVMLMSWILSGMWGVRMLCRLLMAWMRCCSSRKHAHLFATPDYITSSMADSPPARPTAPPDHFDMWQQNLSPTPQFMAEAV